MSTDKQRNLELSSLRAALFSGGSVLESDRVEVNQRHLIDKILARYSVEFTIFRELLQNANDAEARRVEICFESLDKSHEKSSSILEGPTMLLRSVAVKNDGKPFSADDWARLKKIAEGNPDEAKIGFFGVGFYSLFSVCEEPLVASGMRCMAFQWKGDQLYARTADCENQSPWTSMFLLFREPAARPNLDRLAHFLGKSLLFTSSLEQVAVFQDGMLLFSIVKKRSPSNELGVPLKSLGSLVSSPSGLFTLTSCKSQSLQFDLDKRYTSEKQSRGLASGIMNSIISLARGTASSEELARKPGEFHLFLHMIHGALNASPTSKFAQSMERITKKRPGRSLVVSLVYTSHDELVASDSSTEHPIFSHMLPHPSAGKVFIGFETHQTTGCGIHLSAPFVPTVERESIDFVDATLRIWNEELLVMVGKLGRLVYEHEFALVQSMFKKPGDNGEAHLSQCSHILNSFSIHASSPNPLIGDVIRHEFMLCCRAAISIPSTIGIVSFGQIRHVPDSVKSVMTMTPRIPEEISSRCASFCGQAQLYISIPEFSLADLSLELKSRLLSDQEAVACLKWWIETNARRPCSSSEYYTFVASFKAPVGAGHDLSGKSCHAFLSTIRCFANASLFGSLHGLPLPSDCLALSISRPFSKRDLINSFQLKELDLISWFRFVATFSELEKDPLFAEHVLAFLSRHFAALSPTEKATAASLFSAKRCMPTRLGAMALPGDSYFENVTLFSDLANVAFAHRRDIKDEVLKSLGVQTHLPLALVFSRLKQLSWDHHQLIKYLMSVRAEMNSHELDQLAASPIFPVAGKEARMKLSELYFASELVSLLDLPTLAWKYELRAHSDAGRFLASLGMKSIVPWPVLFAQISGSSAAMRTVIFRYFLEHFEGEYRTTYRPAQVTAAIIPLEGDDPSKLSRPTDCFADPEAAVLGFPIAHPELRPYAATLGIPQRPSGHMLVERLVAHKFAVEEAGGVFEYLGKCNGEFSSSDWHQISRSSFIPVKTTPATLEWRAPHQVYFGLGSRSTLDDIFDFIDFGERASVFLRAAGVKAEPTPAQLAERISSASESMFSTLGPDRYLAVLQQIAVHFDSIAKEDWPVINSLGKKPCLLGIRYSSVNAANDDSSVYRQHYELERAENIFAIDDMVLQQIFGVLCAPNDVLLENMYGKLGCQPISKCVQHKWAYLGEPLNTPTSASVQDLIRTRTPLLLHESQSNDLRKHLPSAKANLLALVVRQVELINATHLFRGVSRNQVSTVCLKDSNVLLLVEPFEYFDLATALARLIYHRSRLSDALLLSTYLSASLTSLRAKGFPVDQIMGPAVANGAVGSSNSDSKAVSKDNASVERPAIKARPEQSIVGEEKSTATKSPKTRHSLIDAIRKSWRNTPTLPPVISNPSIGDVGSIKFPADPSSQETAAPPRPANQAVIRAALENAIRACKSTSDPDISTESTARRPPIPNPAPTSASHYCDLIPARGLKLVATIHRGISLYFTRGSSEELISAWLTLPAKASVLQQFADLLALLSLRVFKAPQSAIHMFWSEDATMVAFNRDRALFFNVNHYYLQHASAGSPLTPSAVNFVRIFWFLTFCHELAHNLVAEHTAEHEFYLSAYAETYFLELVKVLEPTI